MYYILSGHEPALEPSLEAWGRWFDTADRRVALDELPGGRVSTIFVGLDYNWTGNGPPLVFETMIFEGPDSDKQWRYATWDEALEGHNRIVVAITNGQAP